MSFEYSTVFDIIDHLILYLVDRMQKGDRTLGMRQNQGVLTTTLAKLLFLVDVLTVQASGKRVTDFQYIRYRFGPYPLAQFEERLSKLEGWELTRQPGISTEGKVYRVFRLGGRPRFRPTLITGQIRLFADEVLTEFGEQRLDEILEHVYSLPIMYRCKFGDPIPLESLQPVKTDEDLVSMIAKVFSNSLLAPLPEAHLVSLREAAQEETNENVQIAERMREQQRQAFRRKDRD